MKYSMHYSMNYDTEYEMNYRPYKYLNYSVIYSLTKCQP